MKNTPDNGSKQADHKLKQQPDIIAETLLDLYDKEQLTINQIKGQKETLNALIKVCNGHM